MTDPRQERDPDRDRGQDQDRTRIELEIEVDASPEEVWRAIATGPGISSWYVPHTVEEREGGQAVASFGEGEDMQIPGRVATWEPPDRVVFAGVEGGEPGLAFEWLVEARDGGSCVVRLVNTGFGDDGPWDEMYDGMVEGWGLFLRNLQLHLAHFKGRDAVSMLPGGHWPGPREAAWVRLTDALGLDRSVGPGDEVRIGPGDGPHLAGGVVDTAPQHLALLLSEPAPGTAFVAIEGDGETVAVSVWAYLYGDDAGAVVERDRPRWQAWLAEGAAAT